jgi:hypothetical protein
MPPLPRPWLQSDTQLRPYDLRLSWRPFRFADQTPVTYKNNRYTPVNP